MTQYASGRWSYAMCDRCGRKYPYKSLRLEWTGLRVCSPCWDWRHEQLDPPRHVYDPQAIEDPRPDNDEDGSVATQLREITSPTHGDTGA